MLVPFPVGDVRRELEAARAESDRLRDEIAERDRRLLAADAEPAAPQIGAGAEPAGPVQAERLSAALDATARPLPEVEFRLTGDLAGTARFLVAGRVRRRLHLGRRLARFQGDRDRLAALESLIAAPLTLQQLNAAGVRPDPRLCLTLAALMIEPEWTAGERFSVAHQDPRGLAPGAHLHIRDARAPTVGEPPHAPVATVIACPADELLGVLDGVPVVDVSISGDQRRWSLIRQWLDRAQCG